MTSGHDLLPLFENAPDLMFTQQVGGTFLIVNRAFERITGSSRQQALKLSLQHLVAAEDAAGLESYNPNAKNGPLQVHIRTAAGELVPMEIHLTSGGERGEIYGLGRDLSQRKLDLQERERT